MLVESIVLVGILLLLFYYYATSHYKFWEKAGVKCPIPSTIRAVVRGTFKPSKDWCTFAPEEPYIGYITLRSLAVSIRDPDLIKHVLSKDFSHFYDRGLPFSEKRSPLSAHLFHLEGRKWKILRAKLSPTFTSGKLRGMFPHFINCVDQMINVVAPYANKAEAVNMNDILSRYTTDLIFNCAFGLQGNSLKDPNDIYLKMVKDNFKSSSSRRLRFVLFRLFPCLEQWVPRSADQMKATNLFLSTFKSTVEAREKSGTKRNDFLDLLIEIRKNGYLSGGNDKDKDALDSYLEFTDNLMAAQAYVFYTGGSETSSSTASFAIVELANNIDIQEKLRAEIDQVLERHGGLTYEAVMEMTYLDQVVSETLRKYPPMDQLMRKVTMPYTMPDGKVTLPVGTRVYIHISTLHHDPKYFPDPIRFDPGRFSPEAKQARHKFVYLPFGEGPRLCIGMRFGLLQVKVALATLISQFEFRPKPGIPYPPLLSKKSLVAALEHGAQVFVTSRTKAKLQA